MQPIRVTQLAISVRFVEALCVIRIDKLEIAAALPVVSVVHKRRRRPARYILILQIKHGDEDITSAGLKVLAVFITQSSLIFDLLTLLALVWARDLRW